MQAAGDFEGMPKREALQHTRELEKLSRNLGGIANLDRLPNAVFVIDTKKEHIAVTEARKLGLPVVAVVDTNCDPDVIDYVIPGNDDAIRSGSLMCRVIADAVVEGRSLASEQDFPSEKIAAAAAEETPVEDLEEYSQYVDPKYAEQIMQESLMFDDTAPSGRKGPASETSEAPAALSLETKQSERPPS